MASQVKPEAEPYLTVRSLLSAYDLLTSGLFPCPYDKSLVDALLSQAKSLATAIRPVFDTASGLPVANLNFSTQQIVQSDHSRWDQVQQRQHRSGWNHDPGVLPSLGSYWRRVFP